MLRMGRNQKTDQPAETESPADHTPQSPVASSTPPPSHNAGTNAYNTNTPYANTGGAGGNGGTTTATAGNAAYGSGSPSTPRAVTESESLARDIKEGTLSGFVGAGTTLSGEANFQAMLRVDGHLSGRVASTDGTLIVSAGGQVDADISVAIALINGTVNGDVIATKRIELGRVAKVNGNIQTPALVVEQGALFEGNCKMVQLRQEQESPPKHEDAAHTTTYDSSTPTPLVIEDDSSLLSSSSDVAG